MNPSLHRWIEARHGGVRCIDGFDDQPPQLEQSLFHTAGIAAGVKAREHDHSLLFGGEEEKVWKAT